MRSTRTRFPFLVLATAALTVYLAGLDLTWRAAPSLAQSKALHLQTIQLSTGGETRTVLFQFSHPPDSIRSFSLSSPARIVIDVHGPVQNISSGSYPAADALLARVRIGLHPHRVRLVLDIKGQAIPTYSAQQQGNTIVARLGKATATSSPTNTQVLFSLDKKRDDAPRQAAVSVPKPAVASTPPTPKAEPQHTPTQQPVSKQARYHLEQGQILYDAGKVDEAIFQWREAIHLAPHTAQAHHLLGVALRDQGKHQQAVVALQEAIRLEPDNATMHVHLARAFESVGKNDEAFVTYKKALQLVPSAPYVHNRLGYLFAAKKDWQGAADEWYQTIQLSPDYAYAYANYGEALEKMDRKQDALTTYQNAVPICVRFTQAFKDSRKKRNAAALCVELRKRVARLQTVGASLKGAR